MNHGEGSPWTGHAQDEGALYAECAEQLPAHAFGSYTASEKFTNLAMDRAGSYRNPDAAGARGTPPMRNLTKGFGSINSN
jgi:hypothetical protein